MTTRDPPETERRPVTETLHDEEITDPYRWLEDDDSEAVAAWTDRQNAYADEVLATPQREVLTDVFEPLGSVTEYGTVRPAGDRYLQFVTEPDDEQSVLTVAESLAALREGDRRVLYDPNDDSGTTAVGWAVPSPAGEYVACGVDEGGREQYDVVVLETATGETVETLPDCGRTGQETLAWVGEETADGFYYCTTGSADDGSQLEKTLRYHELGTDPADDTHVTDAFTDHQWPSLETDGRQLFVTVTENWDRADVYGYHGPPREASLSPVVTGYDATIQTTVAGGRLYLLTDHEAPRSRVLATDAGTALTGDDTGEGLTDDASTDGLSLSAFETIVPESEAVVRSVTAHEDRLYVHAHRDASSELTLYADGEATTVPLGGVVSVDAVRAAEEGVFFRRQSFAEPVSVCRWTPTAGREQFATQDVSVPFEVETSREWATSADGTEVPAFVVRRADVEPDGTNPALLTGYGGFRINRTPYFDRFRLSFLQAGGVFVVATLRGGAEYGDEWHEAGRREQKHHTFEDAEAVADTLVDRGWAAPDRLAVMGGSNGGLLVGALITRDPERFRAAVCLVPLLDMLRFHEFLLGESWTAEYGSPEEPEAFTYLREYSPYHNVEETAYPATLFETALGDTRVHPAHARKTAARVQANNTGPHPIALRVADDTGHGTGKPTSMVVRESAERWGFLADQLDIPAAALRADEG